MAAVVAVEVARAERAVTAVEGAAEVRLAAEVAVVAAMTQMHLLLLRSTPALPRTHTTLAVPRSHPRSHRSWLRAGHHTER